MFIRQKLLKHKYTDVMLWICKIYFLFVLFVFIRVGFEVNNNTLKGIKSAMEICFHFRYARNMIRSCLLNKAISTGATVFLVLRVFL